MNSDCHSTPFGSSSCAPKQTTRMVTKTGRVSPLVASRLLCSTSLTVIERWTRTDHGMGEYRPRTPGAPPLGRGEPPPPPAGAPPPGQYTAPPPAPGQAPVDQRGGDGYAPPQPAPADSRQGYQGGQAQPSQEPQAPADQKQTESTAQSTAPPTYRGA